MLSRLLLGSASLLAVAAAPAEAAITGCVTALDQPVYAPEFALFNAGKPPPAAGFAPPQVIDSLPCQQAFTLNALPGGTPADYAASDLALTNVEVSNWATLTTGQVLSGNEIQLPALGAAVALPINNPSVTANGQATFSNNDLCGIFSGLINNFAQITDAGVVFAPAPIQVVYDSTSDSGVSFWLTNHLADPKICNASNTAPGVTFLPTSNFASVFPGATPPANFHGEAGAFAIANAMAGLRDLGPEAGQRNLSYVAPDLTSLTPGNVVLSNGLPSPLIAAAATAGNGTSALPTLSNVTLGLKTAVVSTPPRNAQQGADPRYWVPGLAAPAKGYPILGYTTFVLAQCYADRNVGSALATFLRDHYLKAGYLAAQTNDGFVPLSGWAPAFLKAIEQNILANQKNWRDDIEDAALCRSAGGSTYPGR